MVRRTGNHQVEGGRGGRRGERWKKGGGVGEGGRGRRRGSRGRRGGGGKGLGTR